MGASTSALQQYTALRDSIVAEREELITRLRAIDEALGAMGLCGRDSYYGPRTPQRTLPQGRRPQSPGRLKITFQARDPRCRHGDGIPILHR
jgi:hypothetical protein